MAVLKTYRILLLQHKATRGFGTENMQKIPGPKSRHALGRRYDAKGHTFLYIGR